MPFFLRRMRSGADDKVDFRLSGPNAGCNTSHGGVGARLAIMRQKEAYGSGATGQIASGNAHAAGCRVGHFTRDTAHEDLFDRPMPEGSESNQIDT